MPREYPSSPLINNSNTFSYFSFCVASVFETSLKEQVDLICITVYVFALAASFIIIQKHHISILSQMQNVLLSTSFSSLLENCFENNRMDSLTGSFIHPTQTIGHGLGSGFPWEILAALFALTQLMLSVLRPGRLKERGSVPVCMCIKSVIILNHLELESSST